MADRGERWRSAHSIGYRPVELERLMEALDWLHTIAYPKLSTTPATMGSGSEWSADPRDSARAAHRRVLRKMLGRIGRLADDIERATMDPEDRTRIELARRGRECRGCARRMRSGARFCDQCGASQEAP